jgi:cysteine synthase
MAPGRKPLVFDRPLRGRIYDSIAETIGNTPLVRIPHIVAEEGITADICLKLEFFNPIASVKDRIGVSMIIDLEASGKLTPGATIVEPTSGNTGIGLAFVAAARGYRLILTMPESVSIERRKMLAFLGAQL